MPSSKPPALQPLRGSLVHALKPFGRGNSHGARSLRISGFLVVAEVGLALAALVTMGLFARTLSGLQNAPAGFDHRNLLVCRLFLATNNYTANEERQFSRRLRQRLLATPGTAGAAYSDSIPLGFGLGKSAAVFVEGYQPKPGETLSVLHASVSPGYFHLLRVPHLAGRDFTPRDDEKAPRVVIVNHSFARRFLNGRAPLGHRVHVHGTPFTIVGMVQDSKYLSLTEEPRPYVYLPFDQVHTSSSGDGGVAFFVRIAGDARGFIPVLRRQMSAVDPNSAGLTAMPLSDYISSTRIECPGLHSN